MTISCADCAAIPKVANAGRIFSTPDGSVQIMHNGLKVVEGGYHGAWMAQIISGLRGHHEPQEELLFDRLIGHARPDSLIVELGAFWSYYSLWYLNSVPGSRAICVEPDAASLEIGRRNAVLNGLDARAEFHNACVGKIAQERFTFRCESTNADAVVPCMNMNSVVALCGGQGIEVLHMDIQGAELPFLESMPDAVRDGVVRFLVVSTHHSSISGSTSTHQDCLKAVEEMGGTILAQHDVQESFSGDGLIVVGFQPRDGNVLLPAISRNLAQNSLFPEL